MKLKIGDKVYLQKYEVAHILHELNSFPAGIMQETFGDGDKSIFIMMDGSTDGFWFEYVYKEPESIKWLMDQDWIVDYDEYVKMSLDDLKVLRKRFEAEWSVSVDEFNAKDEAYRETHFDEESDKFDKFKHKIFSLGYLIDFRKGKIKFVFPDEYHDKTSIHHKRPSFLARLFGRSAQ